MSQVCDASNVDTFGDKGNKDLLPGLFLALPFHKMSIHQACREERERERSGKSVDRHLASLRYKVFSTLLAFSLLSHHMPHAVYRLFIPSHSFSFLPILMKLAYDTALFMVFV